MKKLLLLILILIFILLLSLPAVVNTDIRCNRYIISKGDQKYSVSKKIEQCGEILSKEIIQSGDGNIRAEEWYVNIYNVCYSITFTGGTLTNIGNSERCI